LRLLKNSTKTHDALSKDGRKIQIKATQSNRIAITNEPDYLIVIRIYPDGNWEEIYNGPGAPIWQIAGKPQKNGQRIVYLSRIVSIKKYL